MSLSAHHWRSNRSILKIMTTKEFSNFSLSFANLEDMTKRLVLMPRIEDEGVGAVVASYTLPPSLVVGKKDAPAEDGYLITSVSSDSTECRDEKEETPQNVAQNENDNVVGCILVSTPIHQDLKNADFADILSAIRSQEGPVILHLEKPQANTETETEALRLDKSISSSDANESGADENSSTNSEVCGADENTNESQQEQKIQVDSSIPETIISSPANQHTDNNDSDCSNMTSPAGSLLSDRLANWGSRMRVGAQFAAQAASTAALQAANAATEARRGHTTQQQKSNSKTPKNEQLPLGLHVQTSLGAFLPLAQTSTKSMLSPRGSSELNITNSSVLYVRKSAVEACPAVGYTFQWYKAKPNNIDPDAPLEDWTMLTGSNTAAFQPSATEVGYRLMCVVTMNRSTASSGDSDGDSDDDDDDGQSSGHEKRNCDSATSIRCIAPHVVAADLSLFNGARQALVRGAHFGQLQGQARARGRTFRVRVELGSDKNCVASAVRLDQEVSGTAEPLHVERLYHLSAEVCGSKGLALKLRKDQVSQASILSALLSDEGVLELTAPNRYARESLLLAIGIANFTGKPAQLEPTTILYQGNDSDLGNQFDEESQSAANDNIDHDHNWTVSSEEEQLRKMDNKESLSPVQSGNNDSANVFLPMNSASDHHNNNPTASDSTPLSSFITTPRPEQAVVSQEESKLKEEVAFLKTQLANKDNKISELQQQVMQSDDAVQQARMQASHYQEEVENVRAELHSCHKVYQVAQQTVEEQTNILKEVKSKHSEETSKLKKQVKTQRDTIAELEKTVRSYQNEKAVLSAGIEARESKLAKMSELQETCASLSSELAQQDGLRKELDEIKEQYKELKHDFQKATQLEKECQRALESKEQELVALKEERDHHKDTAVSCKEELQTVQSKNQKLKAERNSYKQKAESLSKEFAHICRNGRSLAEVERSLANEATLQEEVELLRKQKRKALEECHSYRKSYEQNRAAQGILAASPSKNKTSVSSAYSNVSLLERNVELEQLVSELTEYVNAKEMQLETLKQVNAALQDEIHDLAKANMDTNDV